MLTVVTPATSRRLTAVEHVRSDLALADDVPPDFQLERFIDQASAAVVRFCRRTFALETLQETFRCSDRRAGFALERGPVVSVASVSIGGSTIAPAEYELADGSLFRLADSGYRTVWPFGLIAVQYSAGYVLPAAANPTLPMDIERAAILLVGAMISTRGRDPLIKSEDVEGVGATAYWMPGTKSQLPSPEAEALLRPYRLARIR